MTNFNFKPQTMLNRGLFLMMIIAVLSSGMYSCKSKKKLAQQEAAAAEARKIAKAKADLEMIISDDGKMSLEEKEEILRTIKAMNIQDDEVKMLIANAENRLKRLREEQMAREREERMKAEASREKTMGLDEYFDAIAAASTTAQADKLIGEALTQFAGGSVPVLIIIGKFGNEKDYDRPTTINNYLHYLKDQRKSPNRVENVVFDGNGKIKELELIKK